VEQAFKVKLGQVVAVDSSAVFQIKLLRPLRYQPTLNNAIILRQLFAGGLMYSKRTKLVKLYPQVS